MPDYADNYTARWVLDYTCGGMTHKQMWRFGSALDVSAIETALDNLSNVWAGVATLMSSDLTFNGATFYAMGSDIGIPVPVPGDLLATTVSGTLDLSAGPKYLSIPWSTTAGGRQTLFFYGTYLEPGGIVGKDYRVQHGEALPSDSTIDVFRAQIASYTGNDRQPGRTCKNYMNFGVNPSLVRKRRRG